MDGGFVEKKKACEILIAPLCDSSDNEQGSFCNTPKKPCRKRKRESLPDVLGMKSSYSPPRKIPWCMGFTSAARASESESELSEPASSRVYFVKGYDSAVTAVVTDSEDDLFFLNETVEFEPPDFDSDEEEEEGNEESEVEVVVISSEDEDPGAEGGDEYEEGQESDSDIDEDDLWSCPQCDLKNHPLSRQCARCWVERHEWLPHLKRLSSEPAVESRVTEKSASYPSLQKCHSLAVVPAIENLSSASTPSQLISFPQSPGSSHAVSYSMPEEINHQGKSSLHHTQQTINKNCDTKDSVFSPDLCVICLAQPRNASLVHGRTGHQVCCIGCAEKLKENKKKCPVCRKKIQLVVKNFF